MMAPKRNQQSRRYLLAASSLLALAVGGVPPVYAQDTVDFSFEGGIRQGMGDAMPAKSPGVLSSMQDPIPAKGLVPVADPVPSAGTVVASDPIDLNSIELAPGETLVPQAGLSGHSTYAPAATLSGVGGGRPRPYPGMPQMRNCPCPTCPDRRYVQAEALYMKRGGDDFLSYSNRFALDEFDYELGMRITAGFIMECVEGIEFSYTGLMEWDDQARFTGGTIAPANRANLAIPLDPLTDRAAFNTFYYIPDPIAPLNPNLATSFVTSQFQRWEMDYDSFEINLRSWAWEVISALHGIRVINYDESFRFGSTNNLGQQGLLQTDVSNMMIGFQVGLDMLYPVTCTTNVGMRARGGAFVNFSEASFNVANNGTLVTSVNDNDEALSGALEIGSFISQQITQCVSVRAGYELWYLAEMATTPGNTPAVLSPTLGRGVNNTDEVFFHGFTLGGEIKW